MNQVYDNFVLENKYESVLDTQLDLQNYVTVDTSLTENPGVTKKVNVRTVTGNVQEVAMTEGNTENIEVALSQKNYTVGTTQGRFVYYDEEYMTDPLVLDTGLKGLAEKMVNNFTSKAVAEWTSPDVTQMVQMSSTGITFDNIVDAIALLGDESEEGYFLLVNPSEKAGIRKNLKDTLQYVEAFAHTGYIGTVAGVPVIVTKAVPTGLGILADQSAVTLFIKKGAEMEQQRDANIRKNEVYARKVTLVALTNATRVVLIGNVQSDTQKGYLTITDSTVASGSKTISGTVMNGEIVKVFVNGNLIGQEQIQDGGGASGPSNTASWSFSYTTGLKSGDIVTATQVVNGELDYSISKTVS